MFKISVVIPTYNRPDLLVNCLSSLEKQVLDSNNFEVIVVSDGIDNQTSRAIIEFKRNARLNLVYLSTGIKKGPGAARNMGWQNARAPFIAFTDDDTLPDAKWLSTLVESYNGQDYAAYSGLTIVPLDQGKVPTDFALNTSHLQSAEYITANCACTRKALERVGGFDERFKTAWREDSDLQFKFIKNNVPILKIKEAVVIHPVRKDIPWGVSLKEQKKGLYDALLYKKHPVLYKTRLQPAIIADFYIIVLVGLLCFVSLLSGWYYIAIVTFMVVFIMIMNFFLKRIKHTSKSREHVLEMFVTSLFIPFISVYWRIVGSIKFRVFFI